MRSFIYLLACRRFFIIYFVYCLLQHKMRGDIHKRYDSTQYVYKLVLDIDADADSIGCDGRSTSRLSSVYPPYRFA